MFIVVFLVDPAERNSASPFTAMRSASVIASYACSPPFPPKRQQSWPGVHRLVTAYLQVVSVGALL